MSEQNIYKEHYELQQYAGKLEQSLNNIYGTLRPFVSPEGVQLSLQEVVDLAVQQLSKTSVDTSTTHCVDTPRHEADLRKVEEGFTTDVHASEPQPKEKSASKGE